MEEKRKEKWKKLRELIILIAALVFVVWLVWVAFGNTLAGMFRLLAHGDEAQMEAFLAEKSQWKGVVATVLLSAIQVVSIVLPGFAIQIASGVIYGWWQGLLMCYVGYLLGNIFVFFLARKLGDRVQALTDFAGKRKNKSNWLVEKMKSTRPTVVVATANLLPVIPNGIIPYIAARSSIRNIRFVEALMASCWIQILFNCLAGSFLSRGKYGFMAAALGIQIVILIIVSKNGNKLGDRLLAFSAKRKEK